MSIQTSFIEQVQYLRMEEDLTKENILDFALELL